jgi:hypothetical protein
MRWRLSLMMPANRWYPVLQRYIHIIAGRVTGLGSRASPIAIPPSPNGALTNAHLEHYEACFKGRVCETCYDCFGDCDGFVLHERHGWKENFKLKEVKLRELVLKACCEKQDITVILDRRNLGKMIGIRISY